MSEEVHRHLYEPFYTTREVGEGAGLGMSVNYYIIVEQHGGRIDVESEPGRGTRIGLWLPGIE